jgi:RNase P/RNase MRP subunit POP5
MKEYRRRYVRFQLYSDVTIDEKAVLQGLRKSVLSLYGEIILADSRLYISEYDSESGFGIVQCALQTLEQILASAVLIDSINGTSVSFQPLKTSGTIRGLKK